MQYHVLGFRTPDRWTLLIGVCTLVLLNQIDYVARQKPLSAPQVDLQKTNMLDPPLSADQRIMVQLSQELSTSSLFRIDVGLHCTRPTISSRDD